MTADTITDRGAAFLSLRLAMVYGGFFLFLGMFMPYWPVWLKDLGFGPTAIGVLVALTHALKVISSPLIGQISDRSGHRRRVLAAVAAISVLAFGLYFGVRGMVAVALVTVLSHAFIPALLPLTEQFAVAAVRRHAINYGRVRAVGSAMFIVAALAGGALVDRYDAGAVLPFCLVALALTLGAVLMLPSGREGGRRETSALGFGPIFDLLRKREFRRVMVMVSLLQASHGVYYALGTVHWRAQGLDATVIGGLWAVGVVAEIALFVAAGRRIAGMDPVRIFLVVGVVGAVRWSVTAITAEPFILLAVQCLHAMTYGATHLAMMSYLSSAVPDHRAATAQALYSAGPMGLAMGLVLAMSGFLYEAMAGWAYGVMAVMCVLAAGLSLSALARPHAGVQKR